MAAGLSAVIWWARQAAARSPYVGELTYEDMAPLAIRLHALKSDQIFAI